MIFPEITIINEIPKSLCHHLAFCTLFRIIEYSTSFCNAAGGGEATDGLFSFYFKIANIHTHTPKHTKHWHARHSTTLFWEHLFCMARNVGWLIFCSFVLFFTWLNFWTFSSRFFFLSTCICWGTPVFQQTKSCFFGRWNFCWAACTTKIRGI